MRTRPCKFLKDVSRTVQKEVVFLYVLFRVQHMALHLLLHPKFSSCQKLLWILLTPPTGQVLCGLLHDSPVFAQNGPLVLGDTSPRLEDAKAATKEPCQNQMWSDGF